MSKVTLPITFNKQILIAFATGRGEATQLITREIVIIDKTFIIYNTLSTNIIGNYYFALGV